MQVDRAHAPAHTSHQGSTPAHLSQRLSEDLRRPWKCNNIVTPQTR